MGSSSSRFTDSTIGVCIAHETPITVSGIVLSSQSNVFINGLPAATVGDIVLASCGHTGMVVSGSNKCFCNGIAMSCVGDSFVGTYSGKIIGGSSNVFSE
jgi:hypothetical protein